MDNSTYVFPQDNPTKAAGTAREGGLTLRDAVALAAMPALIAALATGDAEWIPYQVTTAQLAFAYADAFLEARDK